MKIIEDTDISLTYIRKKVVFGDGHRQKQTRLYSIVKNKQKKKIDLDAVNNISKFVDGVEWFMVALHSVDRNGDITDDIDPCGLMFDDVYTAFTLYICLKPKQRDYVLGILRQE
jgi:hypothetical protein